MLPREVQDPMYYEQDVQIQGGRIFVYQPFTTTDLLNWKHHTPSFMEKPQALIDLMQSIIQTHKPTCKDCQQLLLTLLNTEEQCHKMLAAPK
jgi:UTP:GlnB (protein PII) uridylyltransferase